MCFLPQTWGLDLGDWILGTIEMWVCLQPTCPATNGFWIRRDCLLENELGQSSKSGRGLRKNGFWDSLVLGQWGGKAIACVLFQC